MKPWTSIVLLATVASVLAAGPPGPELLSVGSTAPPIRVAKWLKGTPVTSFDAAKVYVIEFWATWCVPCKQSIPRLTELARKYKGKVVCAGISVSEKNGPLGTYSSYGDKVAAFVKSQGSGMDYNVAWDGEAASMNRSWMRAAGQERIPTAFIVDRKGRIAWIGNPLSGLEKALDEVVDGRFDINQEASRVKKEKEDQEREKPILDSFMKPYGAGDFKGAVEVLDKLFASNPVYESRYGINRYVALSSYDPDAANTYVRRLETVTFARNPEALNSISYLMTLGIVKGADVKLAIEISEKSVALTKSGDPQAAYRYHNLAYAYFDDHQFEKAVKTEEKALKLADATKDFDSGQRQVFADRLEMYKRKVGLSVLPHRVE